MLLSELTAYAAEQFHIREQHKWADFPGFSVLAEPGGKWVALLMRQWDAETGEELERCDIRCGPLTPAERALPWLSSPFRMKGPKWAGVDPARCDDPERVFRLLDRAVLPFARGGFTIVLDDAPAAGAGVWRDSALPPAVHRGMTVPEDRPAAATPISPRPSAAAPGPERRTAPERPAPAPRDAVRPAQFSLFTASAAPSAPESTVSADVPETIRRMISLYEYGDLSARQKAKNFYVQGKCAEDYEDDQPWDMSLRQYFPVYHDLNIRQLRGYFTWRGLLRRGSPRPAPAAFAYLHLYELLNGVGVSSPAETVERLRAFERDWLDAGLGDEAMRRNLRRWAFDFCILKNLPPETGRGFADPALLERDEALAVLQEPMEQPDAAVFAALCRFGDPKTAESPAVAADPARGAALFAAAWRFASERFRGPEGEPLFGFIFGSPRAAAWYPMANAVHYEPNRHPDADYALTGCRRYLCRGGIWRVVSYEPLYAKQDRLIGFLHETDRQLRRYLKAGHALRRRAAEAWATPFAEAAIEQDRQAALEAARPKVHIDLSGLEQIRRDALHTRDNLLTEEELAELSAPAPAQEAVPSVPTPAAEASPYGLDETQLRVVRALLRGEDAGPILRAAHCFPSVLADGVNEALYDEFGDSVLDCEGDVLSLVEDYREDLARMLGGT